MSSIRAFKHVRVSEYTLISRKKRQRMAKEKLIFWELLKIQIKFL